MKALTIGVKFCGNCNPQISGPAVLNQVLDHSKRLLPFCEFVPWNFKNPDIILVISGCPVDCAARPESNCPVIVVAGDSVDLAACDEDQIGERVAERILAIKRKGPCPEMDDH